MRQPEDKGTGCFTTIATWVIFPIACVGLIQYIWADFQITNSISAVACIGAFVLALFFGLLKLKIRGLSQDTSKLRLDGGKRK